MESNQRKRIEKNIDSLVNLTDFDKLCLACYDGHLLSSKMIQNICHYLPQTISEDCGVDDKIKRERHKLLFKKITKRGPDAFEKLHKIFTALKYKEALHILFDADEGMISLSSSKKTGKPTSGNNIDKNIINDTALIGQSTHTCRTNNDTNITLHEYEGLIQPKKPISVQKANRITIDPNFGTYHMESKNNRGILFMVSSDKQQHELYDDDHSLMSLFQQLGFKVYAYSNISLNKFLELLDELLSSDNINDIECFVLALRAGGRLIDGVQWTTFNDGSVVKVEDIQKYFYHQRCKQLVGKPKIFIYPYSEVPNKCVSSSREIQTDSVGREVRLKQVSQLSDVINCYATTKGFLDHRDNENYSCYIQNFVDVVAAHAFNTHFEDMLKIIQDNVEKLSIKRGHLQIASNENISFNKILYFNPGIIVN
ncbi:caspase Dronc-like [Calliphora vicina]|uniref:caspase Dronc-like n=1 Tax=Calliphora vicina TaxID=7373 RepID=UPI00325C2EC0